MRVILVFVTALFASAAWAQASHPAAPTPAATPAPAPSHAATPGSTPVTPEPAANALDRDPSAQAGPVMRQPEPLLQKPSGFWTSGRPAVGGAYRYRLLAIGTGVLLVTAAVMIWVVRRYPRRDPEARWNN